jgi:hypothetical protein
MIKENENDQDDDGNRNLTACCACQGERRAGGGEPAAPQQVSAPSTGQPTASEATAAPAGSTLQLDRLGSCRPGSQVTAALDGMVEFADPNGDGSVTRAEATSAANFLLGGFFFRADENGDGKVTPEEGREARQELMNRQPALAGLLQQARAASWKGVQALGHTVFRTMDADGR